MNDKNLIEKFIENDLSENDQKELLKELAHNSDLTDELQNNLYMDELLEQSINPDKSADVFINKLNKKLLEENSRKKVIRNNEKRNNGERVRRSAVKRKRNNSSTIVIFTAVAACFIFGLIIVALNKSSSRYVASNPGKGEASNLLIKEIKGTVGINRDGDILTLKPGNSIFKGDIITVGADSSAILNFNSEKTAITIKANSTFEINSDISEKTKIKIFHVETGQVYFDVAHQGSQREFIIKSDRASAKVIGTRLEFENSQSFSAVSVYEGLVKVKNNYTADEVFVPGNHKVKISDENYPDVISISGENPKILSFTLINSEIDRVHQPYEIITNGAVFNRSEIPRKINIRVNVSNNSQIKHVNMRLKDSSGAMIFDSREEYLPHSAIGDNTDAGDYDDWSPDPGNYILETVIINKQMKQVDSKTLTFTVK